MWFAEIFIEEIREDCITLNVASEYIADSIEQRYMSLLRDIAERCKTGR